jgi:hypothetical protein
MFSQFVERPRDPFLSRVVGHAECLPNGAQILIVEKAHHQCVIVGFAQFGHGFIENGAEAFPVRSGFGSQIEVFHGLPFTGLSAEFVPPAVQRDVAGAAAQPTGQRGICVQPWRQCLHPARQADEDALGNLGGDVGRVRLPRGSGIHQVGVPGHEFSERWFRAAVGVFSKKLCFRLRLHFTH